MLPSRNGLSIAAILLSILALAVSVFLFLFGSTGLWSPTRQGFASVQMLSIEDDAGRTRLMLTTLPDGGPKILLSDANEVVRADLSLSPLGDPYLIMSSQDGQSRLHISLLGPGRQPQLMLRGKDGSTRWRVFLDGDDHPVILDHSNE